MTPTGCGKPDEDMIFFRNMKAYDRCPISRVAEDKGKLIDVGWIDTNKGDWGHPIYCSRLVGCEYNTYKDASLYAGTPPLEALRIIIRHAATIRRGAGHGRGHVREERGELMMHDVIRAYIYAPATRSIFIELPKEDGGARCEKCRQTNMYHTIQ